MRFDTVLFDLDGTLTDPYEGIVTCVRYALSFYGIDLSPERLRSFIGPPLVDSFCRECGFDMQRAKEAAAHYRERFERVGWRENLPIPGVAELLRNLKERGIRVALASTKPRVFCEKILQYFDFVRYFDAIVGAEKDGTGGEKPKIVAEALGGCAGNRAAMVGDRKYDVEGAIANGVCPVGVRWGYAEVRELEAAGAEFIAETPRALAAYLTA